MKFYVTFGQKSPFRDGWVEVEAPTYDDARRMVIAALGSQWAMIYEEDLFEPHSFPSGKIGETIK